MYRTCFALARFFLFIFIFLVLRSSVNAQETREANLSGKQLFIENRCVRCHTIGRGRFVGPDLAGVGDRYSKDEIEKWIQNSQEIYQSRGKSPVNEDYPPMPPLNVPPNQAEIIAEYLISVEPSSVQKSEYGVIKGKVMNETTGKAAEDVELTLTGFLGDRPADERRNAETDKEGLFEFEGLPWNRSYALSLTYKGAEYVTDKMVFDPEEDTKTLNLPIYEPTENDRDISVNAAHMIVQIADDRIAVAEIMIFHNGSKKVYVGKNRLQDGKRGTLRFDLPEDVSDVEFITGLVSEGVVRTNQGFVDMSSFAPGIRRIVYAYALPYKFNGNTFEKTINYPTRGFVLLVSDSGNEIKVDGLSGGDTVQIQGGQFLRWSGENLKAGTRIKVEINSPLLGGDFLKWIAFGALIMLVGGSILYSFVRRRNGAVEKEDKVGLVENLEEERARLIQEIAELDDRFEAKEIGEEEYKESRSRKKKRLVEIMRK